MVTSCRCAAAAHCGELTAEVLFYAFENYRSDVNADLEELMTYTRLIFESDENRNRQYLLLASLVNKLSDYVGTARTLEGNENISYIENVIQYISENYGEPLTAGVLADKFYVSSAKLNADFKGMTSVTLHKYIVTVRLINAKRMLISSSR